MRGFNPSQIIIDDIMPPDEWIYKPKPHYNQATEEWFIPKGTSGRAWKDGPLKFRTIIDIKTTHDIITGRFDPSDAEVGYETWGSTKEHLIIAKRAKEEPMWFLKVAK